MKLSNTQYDVLNKLVKIILPAIGSLYFGLAAIWGLPAAEQVVGTIVLISTFLGVFLTLSNNSYLASDRPYDGTIEYTTDENGKITYNLVLSADIDKIPDMSQITFKTESQ